MPHPAPLLPLRASSAPHDYDIQAAKPQHPVSVVTTSDQNPRDTDTWHLVPATVHEDHVIPDRTAKRIVIRAPVGSDVCFEKTSNVKHIKVESTLSRVREEHLTDALVVNTTGAPVTLKQGLVLGKCLLYDRNIISEPLPLPTTCAAAVGDAPSVTEGGLSPSVESFVKVVDYWRSTEMLSRFRENLWG